MWLKTKEYGLNSEGYSEEQEWVPVIEHIMEKVIKLILDPRLFLSHPFTYPFKRPKGHLFNDLVCFLSL